VPADVFQRIENVTRKTHSSRASLSSLSEWCLGPMTWWFPKLWIPVHKEEDTANIH
jgi:hypothetical protein